MARVVVVGGGLAGSATAARLAKTGHEVTLVERLPRLGGAVGSVEQDGYRWDTGPSSTALPAVLRDLFRKSGRPLEKELDLVPVEPLREHRFADGTRVVLPSGSRAAQLDAVEEALGGGLGRQWVDHVHAQAENWDVLRRDYLERSYVADLASKQTRALLQSRTMLAKAVKRSLKDERLRTMALHHAVAGGHDPRNVPAWLGVLDYVEQNFGRWTVPGGFGALSDLLAKRLAERRVTVLTGTTVSDIRTGSRNGVAAPVAVETDAGPVDAEVVVVAIDPRRIPALARHVARTMPALPPSVTHLGLVDRGWDLPPEVVVHDDFILTVRTGGTAPPGRVAWTVLARGRLAEDPVRALARKRLDVRDALEVRIDRSPRELVEQLGGSPYGVLWQGPATVRDRLGTRTPVPGVHLAGAHTGGGGWVPFVGLTAAVVAEEIGPA